MHESKTQILHKEHMKCCDNSMNNEAVVTDQQPCWREKEENKTKSWNISELAQKKKEQRQEVQSERLLIQADISKQNRIWHAKITKLWHPHCHVSVTWDQLVNAQWAQCCRPVWKNKQGGVRRAEEWCHSWRRTTGMSMRGDGGRKSHRGRKIMWH